MIEMRVSLFSEGYDTIAQGCQLCVSRFISEWNVGFFTSAVFLPYVDVCARACVCECALVFVSEETRMNICYLSGKIYSSPMVVRLTSILWRRLCCLLLLTLYMCCGLRLVLVVWFLVSCQV